MSNASDTLYPGWVAGWVEPIKPYLKTEAFMIAGALLPIITGAHAAVSRPSSARKPERKHGEDKDYEVEEKPGWMTGSEGLKPIDALILPLTAGLVLGGLYVIIHVYDAATLLNKILGIYMGLTGVMFLDTFYFDTLSIARSYIFPERYTFKGKYWRIDKENHRFVATQADGELETCESPLPGSLRYLTQLPLLGSLLWQLRDLWDCKFCLELYLRPIMRYTKTVFYSVISTISLVGSLATLYYFTFVAKPWWLTNIIGTSFAYGAIQFMSPTTFATGSLILGVLFFYDIYFVFFTPIMVTVATKLEIPAKLLFPKPTPKDKPSQAPGMSMLGLGDIVIPGMVIALALKFDLYLFYLRKQKKRVTRQGEILERVPYVRATGQWGESWWTSKALLTREERKRWKGKQFPKTYFYMSIVGYICGMLACLVTMVIYKHPQPALLYLVPGVLTAQWGTALVKGDLKAMWYFSDSFEDEDDAAKRKEKEAKLKAKEDKKKAEREARLQKLSQARKNRGFFLSLFCRWYDVMKASAEEVKEEVKEREKEVKPPGPDSKSSSDSRTLFHFRVSLPPKHRRQGPAQRTRRPTSTETPVTPRNKDEDGKHEESKSAAKPASFSYVSIDATPRSVEGHNLRRREAKQ